MTHALTRWFYTLTIAPIALFSVLVVLDRINVLRHLPESTIVVRNVSMKMRHSRGEFSEARSAPSDRPRRCS